MSYKVVETIEAGEKCLSTIPGGWEVGRILYWPPEHLNVPQIRKNPRSVPDDTWTTMKCTVKKVGFSSLKAAMLFENNLSQFSDTEDEISSCKNREYLRQHPTYKFSNHHNLNAEMDNIVQKEEEPNTCTLVSLAAVEDILTANKSTQTEDNSTIGLNNNESFSRLESLALANNDILATLKTSIDEILKVSLNQINQNNNFPVQKTYQEIKNNLPIKCIAEMEELEQKLKNDEFKTQFVQVLSKYGGITGLVKSKAFIYKLFDVLFERNFISKCSWTGASKLKDFEKYNFKKFSTILKIFFEIVYLADTNYSISENELFFKKVLKNSQKR